MKKLTPRQALELLEETFLCEWGQHRLQGKRMTAAFFIAHSTLASCRNPHKDWTKYSIDLFKKMKNAQV